MAVIHADDAQTFQSAVLDEKGQVLVDFWASWCGPCKMMAPIVEDLAEEYPDIKVVKTNIDELREPAIQYGIDSIPAFVLFENGEIKNRAVGAMPMDVLAQKLGL